MTSLGQRFRLVLSKLSDELESADVESLKYICKTGEKKVPAQSLEKATTAEAVFDLMIDHGLLSERNTVQLKNWLQCKKYQPCLELIAQFEIENHEELSKPDSENEGRRIGPCNIQEEMIVRPFQKTSMLDKLKESMEDGDFVALAGLLGCGKSQIAMYYALHYFRKSHPDGICWKIGCKDKITLMNSLKNFCNKLKLSQDESKQEEIISIDESIQDLCDLIKKQIIEEFGSSNHLIILDDVMFKTKSICEIFKNTLTGLKVRVIVTTMDGTFCSQIEPITIKGFSEDEAVKFLQQEKEITETEEKSYHDLVKLLGYHPLLLHGAMIRMNDTRVRPKRFIKDLKGIRNMDKLTDFPDDITCRRDKLFTILLQYLYFLKDKEDSDVFDMILALQYLAIEDIPVLLFDFFPTKDKKHRSSTSDFLEAIQKFSFGILRGVDDGRFITTHLAVVKAIEMETENKPVELKVRLIKKVLTAFMMLMDKDNSHSNDYDRNSNLLPHALSLLTHVEKLKKENPDINDFELDVLLTYVYDIVGYTYNFFGILKNAGEHSTAARQMCFKILGISEEVVDKQVSTQVSKRSDVNHFKSYEEFNEIKAGVVYDGIKKVLDDTEKRQKLVELASSMILNKYRGHDHIKLLESFLPDELEEEYFLTEDEYEFLLQKHLAMPKEILGPAFLFELILQVFYTYGRRVFYLGDADNTDIARNFTGSLYLAYYLARKIAGEFPEWNILYVMLTEQSGVLQILLEDKANLGLKTIENLEKAVGKFEEMLEYKCMQFNYGLVQSETINSSHHRHICFKRLVKCFTTIRKITKDETKLKEIDEKGEFYKKELDKSKNTLRHLISASLSMADFSLDCGNLDDAESKFKVVVPEDLINSQIGSPGKTLSHKELLASKGLTKCYVQQGRIEEAKDLARQIQIRLYETDMKEELAEFLKLVKELNLSVSEDSDSTDVTFVQEDSTDGATNVTFD